MQNSTALLTPHELAYTLEIHLTTLNALIQNSTIPYTYIQVPGTDIRQVRFDPFVITAWLQSNPSIKTAKTNHLDLLKEQYKTIAPKAVQEIKNLNAEFTPERPAKGCNLTKVKNKKLGFVYYARYIVNGKLIPSRWCTHTNNDIIATQWMIENREKLLAGYFQRKADKRKPYADLYQILNNFYAENSTYLKIDADNGRSIDNKARTVYHNFIKNSFIPYLRKEKIKTIEQIETSLLVQFRRYLRNGTPEKPGIKPQTINHYVSFISMIFDHLIMEGHTKINPCKSLKPLKVCKGDEKIVGCYVVDTLKGVFNKRWDDDRSYMLNLIIYTTNMRNVEIERMRFRDIITIKDIRFIEILESKTENGVRAVPLHDFVYKKLISYVKRQKKTPDNLIFKPEDTLKLDSAVYRKAYHDLARYAGYSEEKIKVENIKFYSGRHFWKTLMNANKLGDVEEVFMGHRVSADVSRRYNHRDKQGQSMSLKKAKEVFAILDKALFKA